MLTVFYIFLVSGLFVLVSKYAPMPRPIDNAQPIEGLFILGCYLFGGAIGFGLPEITAHALGLVWGDGWLERGAKVFGAIGGFLIAGRGTVIWASIFVLCVFGTVVATVLGYIFKH